MLQLKTPIIGVLAASVMLLSNPPPANATQSFDYRSVLLERARNNDLNSFPGFQFEFGRDFLDRFSPHKSAPPAEWSVWSSGNWHGSPGATHFPPKEVIVSTSEPSSLLELAMVSLVSAGLWFWRRKPAVLQSSPLNTV